MSRNNPSTNTGAVEAPWDYEALVREKSIAFGEMAAAKQFTNRKGHGGNIMLAERHLTRQQLLVLMAAAFEAGAAWAKDGYERQ